MAVALIDDIRMYLGTAAEMAAMSTTGVPIGSRFTQSDTGLTYIWSGAAWFVEVLTTTT